MIAWMPLCFAIILIRIATSAVSSSLDGFPSSTYNNLPVGSSILTQTNKNNSSNTTSTTILVPSDDDAAQITPQQHNINKKRKTKKKKKSLTAITEESDVTDDDDAQTSIKEDEEQSSVTFNDATASTNNTSNIPQNLTVSTMQLDSTTTTPVVTDVAHSDHINDTASTTNTSNIPQNFTASNIQLDKTTTLVVTAVADHGNDTVLSTQPQNFTASNIQLDNNTTPVVTAVYEHSNDTVLSTQPQNFTASNIQLDNTNTPVVTAVAHSEHSNDTLLSTHLDGAFKTSSTAAATNMTLRRKKKRHKKEDASVSLSTLQTTTTTTTAIEPLKEKEEEKRAVKVSCITWNLAEESPEETIFLSSLQDSDFVFISAQECENIKPRRTEGRRSRLFRKLCIHQLGPYSFVPIGLHSLGGIQLLLFCKKQHVPFLTQVKLVDVACGIGNTFHNKGAIGAFVTLGNTKQRTTTSERRKRRHADDSTTKLLFVSAHLEAHVNNAQGRNDNFWRIITEFESQAPPAFLAKKDLQHMRSRSSSSRSSSTVTTSKKVGNEEGEEDYAILHQTDYIFFCGDLNYRLELPREMVEHHVILQQQQQQQNLNCWLPLLRHDQLLATISQKKAFPYFLEGKITFAPTFKFDKYSQSYDKSSKQRIPAWTDRILFKSNTNNIVKVVSYDSIPNATHSDHRPVHGTFLLQKCT